MGLSTQELDFQKQDELINHFRLHVPNWKGKSLNTPNILLLIGNLKQKNAVDLEHFIHDTYNHLNLNPPQERILINWEEAQEMGQNGITFGSHGLEHRILPTLNYKEKENEICQSLEKLQKQTVPVTKVFCYPNGDWDKDCLDILANSPFLGAVTTHSGNVVNASSPYLLNRTGIHEDISNSRALMSYRIWQGIRG